MFNLDAILCNDEYFDMILYKSDDKTINTISFSDEKETSFCSFIGSKPFESLNYPIEILEDCTFLDLIDE